MMKMDVRQCTGSLPFLDSLSLKILVFHGRKSCLSPSKQTPPLKSLPHLHYFPHRQFLLFCVIFPSFLSQFIQQQWHIIRKNNNSSPCNPFIVCPIHNPSPRCRKLQFKALDCRFSIINQFLMEKDNQGEKNNSTDQHLPSPNEYEVTNLHYYQKYELIYQLNVRLQGCFQEIEAQRAEMDQRVRKLSLRVEGFSDPIRPNRPQRKKKVRRGADQIHKCYTCKFQNCSRDYGSEAAYRTHIKSVHPEEYVARKRGRKLTNSSDNM